MRSDLEGTGAVHDAAWLRLLAATRASAPASLSDWRDARDMRLTA
jgi:hypothetical protein